jgi:hypothetical protein
MYEARSYLQLDQNVDLGSVRDAYCDAIRGVNGRQRMFGDQGVQLAFASLFKATVVCWVPPRPAANAARNMLYRPLMWGSSAATHVEVGARTSCLMMFYVLQEGVGHGEPLLAESAQHGRPSRFTGAVSTCLGRRCFLSEFMSNVAWNAIISTMNFCPYLAASQELTLIEHVNRIIVWQLRVLLWTMHKGRRCDVTTLYTFYGQLHQRSFAVGDTLKFGYAGQGRLVQGALP